MVAFMVMVQVDKTQIKRKIRRLLGKAHIGLLHTQPINVLLDHVDKLVISQFLYLFLQLSNACLRFSGLFDTFSSGLVPISNSSTFTFGIDFQLHDTKSFLTKSFTITQDCLLLFVLKNTVNLLVFTAWYFMLSVYVFAENSIC